MARPIWKGNITFGLVNIPVVLYSAEKPTDIKFKLLDGKNHAHIRYMRVNEQTGKEVPWSDIVKGYEYDEDQFIEVKEQELKKIAGENSRTINIEAFVNKSNIDTAYYEKPYYLVPDKKGDKGYVILREALNTTKKVGIAKVIIHTKEYLAALMPSGNALTLQLLRYAHAIRKPDELDLPNGKLKDYKISSKELNIAKQLISSMTTKWNPEHYKDDYQIALKKWIEEKAHHEKPHTIMQAKAASNRRTDVVDFVSLLRKSLESTSKMKKMRIPPKKSNGHGKRANR